jgi:hypothetical protein
MKSKDPRRQKSMKERVAKKEGRVKKRTAASIRRSGSSGVPVGLSGRAYRCAWAGRGCAGGGTAGGGGVRPLVRGGLVKQPKGWEKSQKRKRARGKVGAVGGSNR